MCMVNGDNVGTYGANGNPFDPDHKTQFTNAGLTKICGQKKWADNFGIYWDGITNYNKC